MSESLKAELEFAVDTAWAVGRISLRYFQTGVQADMKSDDSPVTIADRESESEIRQRLKGAFPADGLIGEEFGEDVGSSGRRWFIDPIDGTKSFVAGVPLFGVLLGLEDVDGSILVGAVYLPALDDMVFAGRGEGAWWNGRRARVSTITDLSVATVCYTSSTSFARHNRQGAWEALTRHTKLARGWGDCYGHVLVATGRAEAMLDPIMNPWDCGPFPVILEEAGGSFTDWQGTTTIHGSDAVSTNGHLRDEILGHLRA
ncbi:MAG: inositol monophosphatase family protein [bacterium]|nr:inositol monophosphatase family protein [bacterium]